MKHVLSLFVILSLFFLPSNIYAENINMKTFGADDCGNKLNTELINETIAELSSKGRGLFTSLRNIFDRSIKLKSNITIELEAGAIFTLRQFR